MYTLRGLGPSLSRKRFYSYRGAVTRSKRESCAESWASDDVQRRSC